MPTPRSKDVMTARAMLSKKRPIEDVVAAFGSQYTAEEIQATLDALRAHRRSLRKPTPSAAGIGLFYRPLAIPDAVISERDRRLALAPRDLTAAQMGDPLPGYSAAERAPSITPSIHRDPLDALMFGRRAMHSETSDRFTAEK